jgi:hypothetical protein
LTIPRYRAIGVARRTLPNKRRGGKKEKPLAVKSKTFKSRQGRQKLSRREAKGAKGRAEKIAKASAT